MLRMLQADCVKQMFQYGAFNDGNRLEVLFESPEVLFSLAAVGQYSCNIQSTWGLLGGRCVVIGDYSVLPSATSSGGRTSFKIRLTSKACFTPRSSTNVILGV